MGYPTTDFSPSVRSNGQAIDASHVNDLQNELSAVVAALRGTITHAMTLGGASLNVTGASTVATLQAGASTLASLQVGASTFTIRPVLPPPDAVQVQSTVINLTNATTLAIPWTHQVFATNSSVHSTSSNPERFTPQTTGIYAFGVSVVPSDVLAASTGSVQCRLLDSSGSELGRAVAGCPGAPSNSIRAAMYVQGLKRFDVLSGSPWVRAEVYLRDVSTHSLSTLTIATFHKL